MTKPSTNKVSKGSRRSIERRSVLRLDERGRQVIRIIDLLRALENTRRGLSVKDLMNQLELDCDQRTVYRDLEQLKKLGFGLIEEDARYRVEGPSIRSNPLTDSQVLAVLLAADFLAPLSGFGVEREFLVLRDSLRARLTPEKRSWVDSLRGMIAVRRSGSRVRLSEKLLSVIEDAWAQEQVLEIEYEKPNCPPEKRIVEPYLLWCHGDQTYLVARCQGAQGLRNFLLVRVVDAKMLDETFDKDPSFDTEEYTTRGFGAFHGQSHEVTVRFSKEVAYLTRERTFHPHQQVEPQSDGSALLKFTASGLPEITAWVAGFGGKVQVLEPEELIEAVRQVHKAGLAAHTDSLAAHSESGEERCGDTMPETPTSKRNIGVSSALTADVKAMD